MRRLERLGLLVYAVLAAAGLGWMAWRGDDLGAVLGATKVHPGVALGAGIAAALAVHVVSETVLDRFRWPARLRDDVLALLHPLTRRKAVGVALVSGIAEECFFRGALLPAIGLVGSALVFGLLHTGLDRRMLGWTGFAVAAGFLLGGLFVATGGLLAPIAAHVLVNGLQLWGLAAERARAAPPPRD